MPVDYVPNYIEKPPAYQSSYEQKVRGRKNDIFAKHGFYINRQQTKKSLDGFSDLNPNSHSQNVFEENLNLDLDLNKVGVGEVAAAPRFDEFYDGFFDQYYFYEQDLDGQKLHSLSGEASYDASLTEPNPQAVWGPIQARLLPETKRTLSKIISDNVADLTKQEYLEVRDMMVYVLSTPASKQRVFELTGFEDKDIAFAEKYFRKYKRKFFFSKLVEIALATSSNGKVSKQIGGLIQFIFETAELNGKELSAEYKYKFIRGIPQLLQDVWASSVKECQSNQQFCNQENRQTLLDLNVDGVVDDTDLEIALNSIEFLAKEVNFKASE